MGEWKEADRGEGLWSGGWMRGGRGKREVDLDPLTCFGTSFTVFFVLFFTQSKEMPPIYQFASCWMHKLIMPVLCSLSLFLRFLHTVFGRPDESTAECMDGDLDPACCVSLAVIWRQSRFLLNFMQVLVWSANSTCLQYSFSWCMLRIT